jgi:hypothetical protein
LAKIDIGTTSSKPEERGKRWVEVPDKDIFEFPFPTIRVNLMAFGPGKHYVEAGLADFIEDRVRIRQKADIAVLQRNPDNVAQNAMTRFGSGRGGNFVANPDSVMQG